MVGEDGSIGLQKPIRSDVYLDSACYRADNRHLVGVIGAQNESSLFSSSLSDLVHHKLRLSSNKILSRQSSSIIPQTDNLDPFISPEETEGRQTINNLLPDEEELFSGIADEMGHMGHTKAPRDDSEDFDLFFGTGGLELDGDGHLGPGQRNAGYPWGALDHASRVHTNPRMPNGSMFGNGSPHERSHLFNGYPSPVRMPSVGSEFNRAEANQGFLRSSNFYPHLDSFSGIVDDIRPKVLEKVNLGMRGHLGSTGHAMELNEGGFAYSPNGIHQHHLRSLLMPNSPSFMNPHNIGRLPGSPGAQHLIMNQLHVGSAPVMKASLSGYQMGRSMGGGGGIHGFSPRSREMTSYGSFSHVPPEVAAKNGGGLHLHSPQQMSGHMFHERNSLNSLPTSFGSPNDRVRSRRNENNSNHSDRKHYELNVERILRGDDSRTTLMIKNIPNKYTSKMLLATIDEQHRGKYDFVYLPIDFKNKCNMGYAFINMIDPIQIVGFHQTFEGRKWEKFNSEKVAALAYARIQGKAALIAHFQNSSLMNEDKRCRPIIFQTDGPNAGDQEPFPMGTSFRSKSGRQMGGGSEEDE